MKRSPVPVSLAAACVVLLGGCAESDDALRDTPDAMSEPAMKAAELGPVDGRDLPPTDLDRIQVGDLAPDFSLESYDDGVVTLSDFRGSKNVVLVFYRGHW